MAHSDQQVSADLRARRYGHHGAVIWLTGLAGAGNSTIAVHAARCLFQKGLNAYLLEGDILRRGINADHGYSERDRHENLRRAGPIAALFADARLVVLAASISPSASDGATARQAAGGAFHEVFVRASLDACEPRDPRGLCRRARARELPEFTGISAPSEPPARPELEPGPSDCPSMPPWDAS